VEIIHWEKFTCKQCGNCCKGDGVVRLTEDDIERLSKYLNISPQEFKEKYTFNSFLGEVWLNDKPNKDCIFLENNLCSVHSVKPRQCENYPDTWRNTESIESCPGMRELLEKK